MNKRAKQSSCGSTLRMRDRGDLAPNTRIEIFVSWQRRLLQRTWRRRAVTAHDGRVIMLQSGKRMLWGGNTMGKGGWHPFYSSGYDPTCMQTAGKTPSELNGTWREQQRSGDQMPSLKPFVRQKKQQLAGSFIHTLFPFPNSWVVRPYCHTGTS